MIKISICVCVCVHVPAYNFITVTLCVDGMYQVLGIPSKSCCRWFADRIRPSGLLSQANKQATGNDKGCFSFVLNVQFKQVGKYNRASYLGNVPGLVSGSVRSHCAGTAGDFGKEHLKIWVFRRFLKKVWRRRRDVLQQKRHAAENVSKSL